MHPTFENPDEGQISGPLNSLGRQGAKSPFKCPACRARQPLQNECRRCQADLSLVVLIRLRIDYLHEQLKQAAKDSPKRQQLIREIRSLE